MSTKGEINRSWIKKIGFDRNGRKTNNINTFNTSRIYMTTCTSSNISACWKIQHNIGIISYITSLLNINTDYQRHKSKTLESDIHMYKDIYFTNIMQSPLLWWGTSKHMYSYWAITDSD